MLYQNVEDLIGKTPLLELNRLTKKAGVSARILAKLESFNPAGSAKDRVALQMILDAERSGLLSPGSTIIEPTSGNTGIGLASLAAARGYRAILTMPETMSKERQALLRAYGAEVVLTPGALGMNGAIEKAKELGKAIPASFIPGQFESPSNSKAHYLTTGPEIWEETNGKIDGFVSAVGTGGTITGTGKFLKEKNPKIQIIAVEPSGSPMLSQGKSGPHGIQGIGAGFIPKVLDTDLLDQILCKTEEEAYAAAGMMAECEGLLVGISSGAALSAALELAQKEEWAGKTIVVLLPDTGERYLSTPLFK